jgi:TPR repeat protein
MYLDGDGVPQDYNEAVAWFRKAAWQGHTDALTDLKSIESTGSESKNGAKSQSKNRPLQVPKDQGRFRNAPTGARRGLGAYLGVQDRRVTGQARRLRRRNHQWNDEAHAGISWLPLLRIDGRFGAMRLWQGVLRE